MTPARPAKEFLVRVIAEHRVLHLTVRRDLQFLRRRLIVSQVGNTVIRVRFLARVHTRQQQRLPHPVVRLRRNHHGLGFFFVCGSLQRHRSLQHRRRRFRYLRRSRLNGCLRFLRFRCLGGSFRRFRLGCLGGSFRRFRLGRLGGGFRRFRLGRLGGGFRLLRHLRRFGSRRLYRRFLNRRTGHAEDLVARGLQAFLVLLQLLRLCGGNLVLRHWANLCAVHPAAENAVLKGKLDMRHLAGKRIHIQHALLNLEELAVLVILLFIDINLAHCGSVAHGEQRVILHRGAVIQRCFFHRSFRLRRRFRLRRSFRFFGSGSFRLCGNLRFRRSLGLFRGFRYFRFFGLDRRFRNCGCFHRRGRFRHKGRQVRTGRQSILRKNRHRQTHARHDDYHAHRSHVFPLLH